MANLQFWNLAIPAPYRLAMMRATGRNWKQARAYSHGSYAAAHALLSPGMQNGKTCIWYTHGGPEFRDERDAGDVAHLRHTGWYTDSVQSDLAIGIVARLPHGRFIAGYRWTSNDERVYFPQVYTDESDAAYAADSHAEQFAESAREDSYRFDAMQDAETAVNDAVESLRDIWVLRRGLRRGSDAVREAIEALRAARETLANATQDYERG